MTVVAPKIGGPITVMVGGHVMADRNTWPPFFTWQEGGASFDIMTIEVTADLTTSPFSVEVTWQAWLGRLGLGRGCRIIAHVPALDYRPRLRPGALCPAQADC